ncbi:MAG: hypothetical protein M1830_003746 [Pleopsidium flavum]|nr:MAG: hypothetical protein M1830_003746 [Pleopsidium flavum]
MSRTTSPHSARSFSTPSSSRSGTSLLNSTYTQPAPMYSAPVARSTGKYNCHRQVASAPASIGHGGGYVVEHEKRSHSNVTSGASSPGSTHSGNEKSPLLSVSGNTFTPHNEPRTRTCDSTSNSKHNADTANHSHCATDASSFDFTYKNIYTTPATGTTGLGTSRGRATIGSGSGVGTGMGACSLM